MKKRKSIHEVRNRINAIKRIDLLTAEIDTIIDLLSPLFDGFRISCPILMPGQKLYRGVKWEEKPKNIDQLKYPPGSRINKLQRSNREGVSRFYSSSDPKAPFWETNVKAGEFIAIGHYVVKNKIFMNNVGFTQDVFNKYNQKEKLCRLGRKQFPITR